MDIKHQIRQQTRNRLRAHAPDVWSSDADAMDAVFGGGADAPPTIGDDLADAVGRMERALQGLPDDQRAAALGYLAEAGR